MKKIFKTLLNYPPGQLVDFIFFRMKLYCIRSFPGLFIAGKAAKAVPLTWTEVIARPVYLEENKFTFLNLSKEFSTKIEWDYPGHGKLWNYQLQGFDFLFQPGMQKPHAEKLVDDFAFFYRGRPGYFEPYPASLRLVNMIKYASVHQVSSGALPQLMYADAKRIFHTVERHLRNNHLLENGFALLFAGTFFNDEAIFKKGKKNIESGLNSQVLPDGGHFERSAMYHQLMLQRVLDAIQLLEKNKPGEKKLHGLLLATASRMLGWMNEVTFENGDMPLMNDAAIGIAPSAHALLGYAAELKIVPEKITLKESGYRKIKKPVYECLVNVGGLEPAENAGHAHADSLHFILYVNKVPFIIDTGTSTYENNARRIYERSTAAHNTVTVQGSNQSELWDSFRVGKRSEILGVISGENFIEASLKFYDKSVIHSRRFEFSENTLTVIDKILGGNLDMQLSFLYVEKKSQIAYVKPNVSNNIAGITFHGDKNILIEEALASSQFNNKKECNRITIQFDSTLITTFTFHKI